MFEAHQLKRLRGLLTACMCLFFFLPVLTNAQAPLDAAGRRVNTTCSFIDLEDARLTCLHSGEFLSTAGKKNACSAICTGQPDKYALCNFREQDMDCPNDSMQPAGKGLAFGDIFENYNIFVGTQQPRVKCAITLAESDPQCAPEMALVIAEAFGSSYPIQTPECKQKFDTCLNDSPLTPLTGGTTQAQCQEIMDTANHPDCANLSDEEVLSCIQTKYSECLSACTDCAVNPIRKPPAGYNGPIPNCAFSYEGCRDTSDVLQVFVNIGKALFGVIGSLAFIMFIYGGFTIMTAMGEAEKFKKGTQIVVAALVGLLIAFGAYLLIDLVLSALQVKDSFKGV